MNTHAPHEVRLPPPPGVIRRAFAAHPRAVDVTIVVFYFLGCALMVLVDIASGSSGGALAMNESLPASDSMSVDFAAPAGGYLAGVPSHLTWPYVLLVAVRMLGVATALFFRRRFPLTGLIVVTLAMIGDQSIQTVPNGVAICFLIYAVPVFRSVAAGWTGYAIAVGGTSLSAVIPDIAHTLALGSPVSVFSAGLVTSGSLIGGLIMNAVWLLAILLLGINIGNRRRYLEAIIDRAHQLARERDQLAQLAVAEERSRIAREMHDIVAHSVSVMIALSEGASRAAATAPEAASDAMQRSAETGRTALAEMRRLLGALHSPGDQAAGLVPQPGVQDLSALVQGFSDAGLRVMLRIEGEAAGDRGQELAVYRIAQESLTNVLRYAGTGARAEVSVSLLSDRTIVEVRDYGPAPHTAEPMSGVGSGLGLAGLAERVRVFGGSIESGPVASREGVGWRVRAILPVNALARDVEARKTDVGDTGAVIATDAHIDTEAHPDTEAHTDTETPASIEALPGAARKESTNDGGAGNE